VKSASNTKNNTEIIKIIFISTRRGGGLIVVYWVYNADKMVGFKAFKSTVLLVCYHSTMMISKILIDEIEWNGMNFQES